MNTEHTQFKPTLNLLDATMIVAGSMIGSGIFIVSADMTRQVGGTGWLILLWLLTGFLTLAAALSYGELSAMFPKAGGQYVYLREAFNPLVGFLYGWSFFAVIQTGTIAAVGVAFSKFAGYFIPALEMNEANILMDFGWLKIYPAQLLSIMLVILLTYINSQGVKGGKIIQTTFTLTKILSLFGLIIFGLLLAARSEIWNANWSDAWRLENFNATTGSWKELAGFAIIGAFATAMVGSVFSSDSWNNVTFIAAEVKDPQKNIGRSLFLGTLLVTAIYVATNIMYISVLSIKEIAFAENDRVAVSAARAIFGNVGTYVIAIMIMISTFGCNNGLILAGARVYYTMAKDKLFFSQAGKLNKHDVPSWALWAQCIWASVLCLSGKYNELLNYVIFVVLIFYILTLLGIIRLRIKRPDLERPYKAIGYPMLLIIYCLLAGLICVGLFVYQPRQTWPGAIIVLLGIPLYYFAVANRKTERNA